MPPLPRSRVFCSLPFVEACLLCRGLRGVFVLLLSAPTCAGPCAVAWNTCSRCSGHTLLLLSVLGHVQHRVRSLLVSPIARPCGRSCVSLRALSVGDSSRDSFGLSQRGSGRVSDVAGRFTATSSSTLLSRRPHRESALRTSKIHLPSAPRRARHRLSVTFEMAWLVLLFRRSVLLVLDLVLRPVDGEHDVELGTIRVPLDMSLQQLLVLELSL